MKKNTFNLKKMKFYFTILSLVLLSFSVSGQVQQNGTLYIGDTGIVYIGTLSSPYTFGPAASMVESTTTRTASYGRLYFPAGSTSIGAVDAHNLNGYVTTVGNADFIMPIGSGTVYAPLRVQPLDISKEIDGAYVALAPTGTVDSSTLNAISTVEYWDMPNSADAGAKITLSWRSASDLLNMPVLGGGATTAISDIVIAGYNTSSNKWERIESVVDGQNYFDNS
ncbi:hypothetical protein, partial [uncultured Flavobacterium sp.]|uniref:hypothetical protein n=1 Tax=uncultured Flavobacterium sp. TaxID=165435 RepID=UPI0030CA48D0